ncbi:UNVERIFIED_CONTAM: hypothetical protein GTU68_015989 [Idotea baltica]|nr:hypothetical protein [Idotea baltica]
MATLRSQLSTKDAKFISKDTEYRTLVKNLTEQIHKATFPESARYKKRQAEKMALCCDQRIQTLIDPDSGILEIAPLAGNGLYENTPAGAGLRTVIARVSGKECMIVANNSAVKGGTYFPVSVKKHLRAQQIAAENKLPCIYLVDSGGAFLPLQDEVFPDSQHFGRIFFNQANMSKAGIPQVSLVLGSCTAGGAYVPAMSDMVFIVKEQGTIFLGGPPLVKAATGEVISAEELGGGDVHTKISGVADLLVDSDVEACMRAREHIRNIPRNVTASATPLPRLDSYQPPKYDPKELYGVVGNNLKSAFDINEVLARLVDGSEFEEFKPDYGESLCCGFASIYGYQVGIIANRGILFSESALKGAHFIQLCSKRGIPLLFLQNIVGFMVGKDYEHEGIAKHGAKMVNAVACARVPKFTVIIGGSFGAGNYSMCGRAYDPRFLFTWPNARISVMGGAQAASVLSEVKQHSAARKNQNLSKSELEEYSAAILEQYENQGQPYYATARLWDDGIIDPSTTREQLALAFAATRWNPDESDCFGVFRM